jgi:hypothetical protein
MSGGQCQPDEAGSSIRSLLKLTRLAGMPEPPLTDRVRELAEKPGEEAAFEAALRTDLEEERRRIEEVEREFLDAVGQQQEPPGAPETAAEETQGAEPRPATGG